MSAMKREVTCDKCHGKGQMPVPEALQETLSLVPARGTISTLELHRRIPGISMNAQNNRLERLRDFGFVRRTRVGKFWRYSRA